MSSAVIHAVAAVGDAGHPATWSGIPSRFLAAGRQRGWPVQPWRLDWAEHRWPRRWWNLGRLLRHGAWGGYQYSDDFLARAEAAIPAELWNGRVLTFHQHFPRARSARRRGASLVYYVDAAFASFCRPGGLAARLPRTVRERAIALERENFQGAERVVTMARWAADWIVAECGVPAERVATILPGANLELPAGFRPAAAPGWPGRDRPLVLGFVGKDWRRKGLLFLLDVRDALERAGVPAEVRALGFPPGEVGRRPGLHAGGFVDQAAHPRAFAGFLAGCDLGCLFSRHEPLGISTLEFLRVGVPVAGFALEGLRDTLPPAAGLRFEPAAPAAAVAEAIRAAFADPACIAARRRAAEALSARVTWARCAEEWSDLLAAGRVRSPLQPWREGAA